MPPESTIAPTLQDIARAAGVSLATASRVLNGSTRQVAESYRERVEAAAARLGYTANLSAQATARGTSAMISLLVADIADPYFAQIAAGVARGADEAGLLVTISTTDRDPEREIRLVRAMRGQRPRGIILAASRVPHADSPELAHELTAVSHLGTRVVALGPGAGEGVRSVGVDNTGGARALAEALTGRGYRAAIVLAAADGVRTSDDRLAGFRAGFEAGGGRISAVLRGGFSRESGRQLAEEALSHGIAPGTLLFGISDVVALGALSALRAAGRDAASDIALAGFDDIPTAHEITPGLTTVRVPLEEFGYRALLAAVAEEWAAGDELPVEVVLRGSTPGIHRRPRHPLE